VKYASIKVLVLLLGSGGLIAACASGSDSLDFSTGAGSGATVTSGSGNGGNGGENSSATGNGGNGGSNSAAVTTGSSQPDAGDVCVPKCTADSDCQNSCPVAQTGINCCDAATGFCYVDPKSICPAPQPDGGVITPPY
jgi:hypothetical protein